MFWKKWFGKKEETVKERANLGALFTDIHSHLLPGIDDGAKDPQESIELIKGLVQLGYKKFITTPHIMWDYYKNDINTISEAYERLKSELEKYPELAELKIEFAAEYMTDYYFEKIIDKEEKLLTFGDNYVLFELPFNAAPLNLESVIFKLQTQRYKPVLAHPERYLFWYENQEKYQDLKDRGVFFQLNLNSLTGQYAPEAKKTAEWMIENKMIDFLGSDCHHNRHVQSFNSLLHNKHLHDLLAQPQLLNTKL